MAPIAVQQPYQVTDFIPLDEHASETPTTFFSLTPVLHLQCPEAKLSIRKDVYAAHEVFSALPSTEDGEDAVIDKADIWVTSKFLGIWHSTAKVGVQIDYHSIMIHGQQGNSIMLEVSMSSDEQNAEVDDDLAQINIIPDEIVTVVTETERTNGHSLNASATALYKAIEACQELNPSPADDEDQDDNDMPSFPGAGGWITSENADMYLDEDGQFQPPAEWSSNSLGPGAGHTRSASEEEHEDADTKWQRTD